LLLVSDPVVRSILKETLEREGYTVLATGDLRRYELPQNQFLIRT